MAPVREKSENGHPIFFTARFNYRRENNISKREQ